MKQYADDHLQNIVFPLGGIGVGNIGLAGNGELVDCEIFHHPNRESKFGYTNFAVKAENAQGVLDCRILKGHNTKDFQGTTQNRFGAGNPASLAGFRHFDDVIFSGRFPFASVRFHDRAFPGTVTLEAFSPFIPSNDADSSLPAAFFTVRIKNTSQETLTYSAAFSVSNPFASRGAHQLVQAGDLTQIVMHSGPNEPEATRGDMTLAAGAAQQVSYQQNWYRGYWGEMPTTFLKDFSAPGALQNRVYETPTDRFADTAVISLSAQINAGQEASFRFLLTWYIPQISVTWVDPATTLKCYYATRFETSKAVSDYCFANWERLQQETELFASALYSSSLPPVVTEAIQGNLAILKSTTCLRLEDGSFWGWEGSNRTVGSCPGTCQHVWAYAYAMPFLFPKLEKGVRSNEFDHSMNDNGMMLFRTSILMDCTGRQRACVDGQMGAIMQAYRDWKISGDDDWLHQYWPKIKKAMEYAWSPDNQDHWDPEQTGVLTGRQHHSLDTEMFGIHAWPTGFYHGALLAAAEMADFAGEPDTAALYRDLVARGQKLLTKISFNGEYYIQAADLHSDAAILPYDGPSDMPGELSVLGDTIRDFYWDDEIGQMRYQIGEGCEIDQVVADWHTDLIGLPNVFPKENRISALRSIYRHNFKSMHDVINPWRVFACNDEAGVVMCAWPDESRKPAHTILDAEECMSGFEYAVACNMLQCGMEEEALQIVCAIRHRYDGKKRNPWAELECGASYSRAMASYSFLLTYSGFRYDLSKGMLGFFPVRNGRYFWSVDGAWGTVAIEETTAVVSVLYGKLSLNTLQLPLSNVQHVVLGSKAAAFTHAGHEIRFASPVLLDAQSDATQLEIIG